MKFSKIAWRFALSLVLFGVILSFLILFIGYTQFSVRFDDTYEKNLEACSKTALAVIDADKIEYYSKLGELAHNDESYIESNRILNDITEKFQLNFIYVAQMGGENYDHPRFIFDTVKAGSDWTAYHCGFEMDFKDAAYNESVKQVYLTEKEKFEFTEHSNTGSHLTYFVPVKNSKGQMIAFLGIEKSTQDYVDSLFRYLKVSVISAVAVTVVLVIIFILYSLKKITNPLTRISEETIRFKKERTANDGWNRTFKSKDEISSLANDVDVMERDIIASMENLTKVTAEKERISTELDIARNIQSSMLPAIYPAFPERKDFDLYATMTPAKEVGGDLFDYLLLDDDHLLMVVGDVSGKGIPASMFMVITKTLIQTRAFEGFSPMEIVSKTNYQLCQNNELSMFVTMWLGVLTLSTGELKFINAAHPFPIFCHGGEFQLVKTKPNLMLGGMEWTKYQEHSIYLQPGDKLFIYTDGVTEAKGYTNELFGDERTMQSFKNAASLGVNSKETIAAIKSDIDKFVQDAPQFDDITMMVFELK